MKRLGLLLFSALLVAAPGESGETTRPWPGLREHTPDLHALVGATVVVRPGEQLDHATLLVGNGRVLAVGTSVKVPKEARVWNVDSLYIYPGLIDPYTHYGLASGSGGRGRAGSDAQAAPTGSGYWNAKVRPDRRAATEFGEDTAVAAKLRELGFVAVLTVPEEGIFTGTAAVVSTGRGDLPVSMIRPEAALGMRFATGSWDSPEYPGSLMGVMAQIRQTYLDAEWHRSAHAAWSKAPTFSKPERIGALAELSRLREAQTPMLFEVTDEHMLLRADRLARELALPAIMRGSNYEYRRLDQVAKTGWPVILPLDFPKPPAVGTPEEALSATLSELRHWYLAPDCARRLTEAGVKVAFTTDGLKDKGAFFGAVRKCVKRGLTEDQALAALTVTPASILGLADRYGTLDPGKSAGFVVTTGPLFAEETRVLETWVEGARHVVTELPVDVRGVWAFAPGTGSGLPDTLLLRFAGGRLAPKGTLGRSPEAKLSNLSLLGRQISFSFSGDSLGAAGIFSMSATLDTELRGTGAAPGGAHFTWHAVRTADTLATQDSAKAEPTSAEESKPDSPLVLSARQPGGEFGFATPPAQEKLVAFTGATLWTSGPLGVLENATLVVAEGKVVGVGAGLKPPSGARVVDASKWHITPGLIDCHSHSAIAGSVNEGTQTITSEVRIGDVVDPDDIALYRELAGGLTTANLLHGSANAIGGQNQVIKLRWGLSAEEMKLAGAPEGIKFALGENPKQSNWGDNFTSRYPQTRMGVEQIIRDAFVAARDYRHRRDAYRKKPEGPPVRIDLELEALVEIMDGRRLVHSHSYRQDEILMLTRLAEEFGFRVATFQHVLEGYKVADRLAQHGAGASSFSDWWAYKFEVYDAIPHNGALMHGEGVLVSFNSDSGELARRLNTEAAKAVKYGGVPPHEALKFVTLNPALQLGIGNRVGSLEPGKDADFAVWTGDPLSAYSSCLQTWIDGRLYFDREKDQALRDELRREKSALIQKVLAGGEEAGGKSERFGRGGAYSCTDHGGHDE